MYKKIALNLFICFILTLSPSIIFAQENQLVIPELGTLSIPSEIELIHNSEENTMYKTSAYLLVKEAGIWHSINIETSPLPKLNPQSIEKNLNILSANLDRLIDTQLSQLPHSRVLESSSITNSEQSFSITKIAFFNKTIYRSDFCILKGNNGSGTLFVVTSTDAEYEYWRPIITKIINSLR